MLKLHVQLRPSFVKEEVIDELNCFPPIVFSFVVHPEVFLAFAAMSAYSYSSFCAELPRQGKHKRSLLAKLLQKKNLVVKYFKC